MARVCSIASRVGDFTGGILAFDVGAPSLRILLRELDERFPGLGRDIEENMAIAIDGEIFQDALDAPIREDSEIVLIPRISGG